MRKTWAIVLAFTALTAGCVSAPKTSYKKGYEAYLKYDRTAEKPAAASYYWMLGWGDAQRNREQRKDFR